MALVIKVTLVKDIKNLIIDLRRKLVIFPQSGNVWTHNDFLGLNKLSVYLYSLDR